MTLLLGTGTITGTGTATPPGGYVAKQGYNNVSISGTFAGTCQLVRSFDGGTTFLPRSDVAAFTGLISQTFIEAEDGVQYGLNCSTYTSGTGIFRFSR